MTDEEFLKLIPHSKHDRICVLAKYESWFRYYVRAMSKLLHTDVRKNYVYVSDSHKLRGRENLRVLELPDWYTEKPIYLYHEVCEILDHFKIIPVKTNDRELDNITLTDEFLKVWKTVMK